MKRKIIKIDEEKCNGCGLCIPNCPEGALRIIDGKARIVSDLYCDGLGACIGYCQQGAITIEQRESVNYDERRVMENIVRQGKNVIKAHLKHLKEHNQDGYLKQALEYLEEKGRENPLGDILYEGDLRNKDSQATTECPGTKIIDFRNTD